MLVNAPPADCAPVPPYANGKAFTSDNALNAGDAVVLISCAVLIVIVLPEPTAVTPLPLVRLTIPAVGVAEPVVPTNEFAEVFALAYAEVA